MTIAEMIDISKSVASSYIVGNGIPLTKKDTFDEYLTIFEYSMKELNPEFQINEFTMSQEIITDLAKSIASVYLTCVVRKLQFNKILVTQEYFYMFNYTKNELSLRYSKLQNIDQVEDHNISGKSLK